MTTKQTSKVELTSDEIAEIKEATRVKNWVGTLTDAGNEDWG